MKTEDHAGLVFMFVGGFVVVVVRVAAAVSEGEVAGFGIAF